MRDAAFRRKQRERQRPNTVVRVREAAHLAAENARTVEKQGGDAAPFRHRGRRLRVKAVTLRVAERASRVARARPRASRPRARGRRAASRGKTRAGPAGGEPPGDEPEPPSPLVAARADALAERLGRSEIRLDEQGLSRLRDIGLGGRRLEQAVDALVADGRAEIVRRGPIVCLRQRGEGE